MFNKSISIIVFPELYNILNEIENIFKFDIINYKSHDDFLNQVKIKNLENLNTNIIVCKKDHKLLFNKEVNRNAILILNELPIKIEKFKDIINTKLIKQKYNFQSKLNIKNYILNFNSRVISNQNILLKLTEREMDIILFLNDKQKPQSINELQKNVWGYSFNLETHTVETHIYRLRKKIKDKFNDDEFIISYNNGYMIQNLKN